MQRKKNSKFVSVFPTI